jgi:mannosyl-3-phosphoglycerate phosphatase
MILLFTDLDGTLLDPQTYSWEPAESALAELRRMDIPVIFCTSKTRAEVEALRAALGNVHPFIVENGGAVFVPEGYFPFPWPDSLSREGYRLIELGAPHADLLVSLRGAAAGSRCKIREFSSLSPEEIAGRCGLTPSQAELAKRREYDEPFEILEPARTGDLLNTIQRLGRRWTRGDDWYHITGDSDKARAVKALAALYSRAAGPIVTAGIGDGLNDARLLKAVDQPFIVRSRYAVRLKRLIPQARLADSPGPRGWNQVVWEGILRKAADH